MKLHGVARLDANVPSEDVSKTAKCRNAGAEGREKVEELERKIRDLEITNRVKEQFIGLLEKDREKLSAERENYVQEVIAQSRRLGQLEVQVRQLGAPSERVRAFDMGMEIPSPFETKAELFQSIFLTFAGGKGLDRRGFNRGL